MTSDDRLHHPPSLLHPVGAGEQGLVPLHHVQQQPRVGAGRLLHPEGVRVAEVHGDRPQDELGTGLLGEEGPEDPLLGLEAKGQHVVAGRVAIVPGKGGVRRRLELDGDLRELPRQPLARAEIEGHPAPPPVVDREPERHEGRGGRVGRHALLVPVGDDLPPVHRAGCVLAQHRVPLRVDRLLLQGTQHLHRLVPQRRPVEAERGLHGGHAEELQEVVLHHVADHPGAVVETRPGPDPQVLGDGDLHVVDVVAVPDRLPARVRQAEDEHVLHRLLPQEMVDPVDLLLLEDPPERAVQRAGAREVLAERLLDHKAAPTVLGPSQPGGREAHHDRLEERRRDRQVEEGVVRDLVRLADPRQLAPERRVVLVRLRRGVHRQVVEATGEGLPGALVPGAFLTHGVPGDLPEALRIPAGPRRAQDGEPIRKQVLAEELEQGREEGPPRQVSGGPEDDHDARLRARGGPEAAVRDPEGPVWIFPAFHRPALDRRTIRRRDRLPLARRHVSGRARPPRLRPDAP